MGGNTHYEVIRKGNSAPDHNILVLFSGFGWGKDQYFFFRFWLWQRLGWGNFYNGYVHPIEKPPATIPALPVYNVLSENECDDEFRDMELGVYGRTSSQIAQGPKSPPKVIKAWKGNDFHNKLAQFKS